MTKQKLKWSQTEDIAFSMIDQHPYINPNKLSLSEIRRYVSNLPLFSEKAVSPNNKTLEAIQARWYEERMDMEDELGPLVEAKEEEVVDEDEYRADIEAADTEEDEEKEEEKLEEEDDEEEEEKF